MPIHPLTGYVPAIRSALYLLVSLAIAFLCMTNSSNAAQRKDLPSVTVLADTSLTLPITQIARNYARQAQVSVSTSFASAKQQSQRIQEGVEANIFISAKPILIRELTNKGLVDVYSQTALARNQLALTTSTSNGVELRLSPRMPLANIPSSASGEFFFILGDPEYVSQGTYALEAIRSLKLASQLEPYFLFLRDNTQMQEMLLKHNAYGIMYVSEAKRNKHVRVIDIFPENTHSPIIYEAVVVAGENMPEAREFMQYLSSPAAQKVFESFHFIPVEAPSSKPVN